MLNLLFPALLLFFPESWNDRGAGFHFLFSQSLFFPYLKLYFHSLIFDNFYDIFFCSISLIGIGGFF